MWMKNLIKQKERAAILLDYCCPLLLFYNYLNSIGSTLEVSSFKMTMSSSFKIAWAIEIHFHEVFLHTFSSRNKIERLTIQVTYTVFISLLRFNAVANRRHSSSDFWRPLLCILFSLCSCFRIANVPSAHICLSRMILR